MNGPIHEDLAAAGPADKRPTAAALLPAPGFSSLLGRSLMALLRGPEVFRRAAARETPALWAMALNVLVFAAAGLAAVLVLKAVAGAGAAGLQRLALLHAAGVAAAVAASFVLALAVDVIARLGDSDADYLRSYQIVSLSSGVAVLGVAAWGLPGLWFLPTAWLAFLIGSGIQKLHGSRPERVWPILGALAAAALAGQWYGMRQYRAISRQAASAAAIMGEVQRFQADLQRSLPPLLEVSASGGQTPAPQDRLGYSATQQGGGLDSIPGSNPFRNPESLVLPPQGAGPQDPQAPPYDPAQSQAQAAVKSSAMMLRSIMAMLKNPEITKGSSPEQARQFNELVRSLESLERGASQGKPPSDAEMAKILQIFMAAASGAALPGAGPPQPRKAPARSPKAKAPAGDRDAGTP
ncbi:MAG: hypothetical protein WC943_08820 [Elusimicrobiota bacterium]|jgi:hypothetical protein